MYTPEKTNCSCGKTKNVCIDFVGKKVNLDLSLSKSNYSNDGILYGKVVSKNGNPIPKAIIKIITLEYKSVLFAETDINGNYFFSNIPINQCYKLILISKGYEFKESKGFYIKYGAIIKINITLSPEINSNLAIIVGDVFDKSTSLPISTATVMLHKFIKNCFSLCAVVSTNEFGQFAFTNLNPGVYKAKIYSMGYKATCYKLCLNQCGQIINMLVPLCSTNTKLKGTVSGIITDQHNKPINEADVILYKVSTSNSLIPIDFTRTNKDGVYLFVNVDIGNYKIKATQKQYFSKNISFEDNEDG